MNNKHFKNNLKNQQKNLILAMMYNIIFFQLNL